MGRPYRLRKSAYKSNLKLSDLMKGGREKNSTILPWQDPPGHLPYGDVTAGYDPAPGQRNSKPFVLTVV